MPTLAERMRMSRVSSPYEALGIQEPRGGFDSSTLAALREERNLRKRRADIEDQALLMQINQQGNQFVEQRDIGQIAKRPNTVYNPSVSEQIGQKRVADIVHADPEIAMQRDLLKERQGMAMMGMEQKQQDIDIRKQRADVYKFRAEHPGAKFERGDDGILRAMDPITQQVTELGRTGMSDEEVINLNQENALGRISTTGEEARKTVGARGEEERKNITARGEETRITQREKPLPAEIPSRDLDKFQVNYNVLINRNPEYRKFIKLNSEGIPQITQPGENFFGFASGPTQKQYDEIYKFIFGSAPTSGGVSDEGSPLADAAQKAAKLIQKYTKPGGK